MPNEHQNYSPSDLGQLIRRHRTRAGLSMLQLAKDSRVDVGAISRLESGEYKALNPDKLRRIAAALGDEVEDYFALTGHAGGLPGLMPYLRAKYDATPETAAEVERYFNYLNTSDSSIDASHRTDDRDVA